MRDVHKEIRLGNYTSTSCFCKHDLLKNIKNVNDKSIISTSICNVTLVPYTEDFLEYSWGWLNDDEIKRMTNTPNFSKEQQKTWYKAIKNNPYYKIWGINYDGKHIGACGLKNFSKESYEYWGYIGEKEFWGKGIGTCTLSKLIFQAKTTGLKSIWLQVREENQRAINLYYKFGFISEKLLEGNLLKMRLIL